MDGHEQIWPASNLLFYSWQFDIWFRDQIKPMHKSFRKQREILILQTHAAKNKYLLNDRRENACDAAIELFEHVYQTTSSWN